MSTSIIYVKRLDTYPTLTATIRDSNGAAVDLTNATAVTFFMKNLNNGKLKINGGSATFVNPKTSGQVNYAWATNDLDTVGDYEAEFRLTWPTGARQGAPQQNYLLLNVMPEVS